MLKPYALATALATVVALLVALPDCGRCGLNQPGAGGDSTIIDPACPGDGGAGGHVSGAGVGGCGGIGGAPTTASAGGEIAPPFDAGPCGVCPAHLCFYSKCGETGSCEYTPTGQGAQCVVGDFHGYCGPESDDPQFCLECNPFNQATCNAKLGTVCAPAGVCLLPHCLDNKQDLGETDVDCGGNACPKCAPGQGCATPDDCASASCSDDTCD